nr:hypothetical protein [Tanacetum cinerariifolium]
MSDHIPFEIQMEIIKKVADVKSLIRFRLRESLVLFVPNEKVQIPVCGVWKMEHDESFTKLFTIRTPGYTINKIFEFRKNGELVMETAKVVGQFATIELYEHLLHFTNHAQNTLIILVFLEKSIHSSWALTRKHYFCSMSWILVYVLTSIDYLDDGLVRETPSLLL